VVLSAEHTSKPQSLDRQKGYSWLHPMFTESRCSKSAWQAGGNGRRACRHEPAAFLFGIQKTFLDHGYEVCFLVALKQTAGNEEQSHGRAKGLHGSMARGSGRSAVSLQAGARTEL